MPKRTIHFYLLTLVLLGLFACAAKNELQHHSRIFSMNETNHDEIFNRNKRFSFNTILSAISDSRLPGATYRLVSGYRDKQGNPVNPYPADLLVNDFDAIEHNQAPEDRIVKVEHSAYSELIPLFGKDVNFSLNGGRYDCEWSTYCPKELKVMLEADPVLDLTNPELLLTWDPDPIVDNVRVTISWLGLKQSGTWTDDTGKSIVYVPDTGRLKLDKAFLKDVPVDASHFRLSFKRYLPKLSECNLEKFKTVCYSQYNLKLMNFAQRE